MAHLLFLTKSEYRCRILSLHEALFRSLKVAVDSGVFSGIAFPLPVHISDYSKVRKREIRKSDVHVTNIGKQIIENTWKTSLKSCIEHEIIMDFALLCCCNQFVNSHRKYLHLFSWPKDKITPPALYLSSTFMKNQRSNVWKYAYTIRGKYITVQFYMGEWL